MNLTGPETKVKQDVEKALNAEDINAIIRVCKETGVAELKFGNLQVSFQRKIDETQTTATLQPATADTEISDEQRKKQTQDALIQDELRMKEDRISNMLIENPLEAERLIEEGELVEDGGGNEPDEDVEI